MSDWLDAGTARFLAAAADLSDADLTGPSGLAGWSRAHVLGHVARNADALTNLLTWARTGVATPMYADREQRAADIERSSGQAADELRADVFRSDARFTTACADLPAAAWDAEVRTATGRAVPARTVLWMRTREVWVHAVDLDLGFAVIDFPSGLVNALLDDVVAMMSPRMAQAVRLAPTDRDRTWTLGPSEPIEVNGSAADLLAWAIGRPVEKRPERADHADLPDLPNWL